MPERVEQHRSPDGGRSVPALDERHPLGVAVPRRRGVEHETSAERRLAAEDHAIAARGHDLLGEPQLRPPLAGADDPGGGVCRAEVDRDARAVG